MLMKETYMCCSYCYTDYSPDLNHLTGMQIRQKAKIDGWKYLKGQDVCPKCFNKKIHLAEKSK